MDAPATGKARHRSNQGKQYGPNEGGRRGA